MEAYGFLSASDGDQSAVPAYLIRPDGYISYRSSALDSERLLTHLARTFASLG